MTTKPSYKLLRLTMLTSCPPRFFADFNLAIASKPFRLKPKAKMTVTYYGHKKSKEIITLYPELRYCKSKNFLGMSLNQQQCL